MGRMIISSEPRVLERLRLPVTRDYVLIQKDCQSSLRIQLYQLGINFIGSASVIQSEVLAT